MPWDRPCITALVPVLFALAAGIVLGLGMGAMAQTEDAPPLKESEACLDCHDDVAHDFMQTSHWNWAPVQTIGNESMPLGKKNIIKIGGGAAINLAGIVRGLGRLNGPTIIVHGANADRDDLATRRASLVSLSPDFASGDGVSRPSNLRAWA